MTTDELSLLHDSIAESRPRVLVHPRYMLFAAAQLSAAAALLDDIPADESDVACAVSLSVDCIRAALGQLLEGARYGR